MSLKYKEDVISLANARKIKAQEPETQVVKVLLVLC